MEPSGVKVICITTPRDHVEASKLALIRARSWSLMTISELSQAAAHIFLAATMHFRNESDILDGRHELELGSMSDEGTT